MNGNAAAVRQVQFDHAANDWAGNLTLNPTASLVVNGTLNPGTASVYHLRPGAAGAGNSIGGTGSLRLAGTLAIDLSGAVPSNGATWSLLTTASRTFDAGFAVAGPGWVANAAAVGSRVWTGGGGDYEFDESTGVLRFIGILSGYAGWSGTAGLTAGVNDGAEQNADNDGYSNLLEYQLRGNPLAFEGNLVAVTENETGTHLVFTFERYDLSESDSTLNFRWSGNLATWNTVPIGAADSPADANGVTVDVTEDGGATADYDRIEVRLPKSNAAGGRLFGQLQGTRP